MHVGRTTPVLRIFDDAKAREFYLGYLGFTLTFEHRHAPELPNYMGVARGDCLLHLSEHHGDASPGASLRIEVVELEALRDELLTQVYRYARPVIEATPWGTRDMLLTDPFGNRLTFHSPRGA